MEMRTTIDTATREISASKVDPRCIAQGRIAMGALALAAVGALGGGGARADKTGV